MTGDPSSSGGPPLDDVKDVQLKAGRDSGALQRACDDTVYGYPRPHGLASPANSLGTESLVTPITTPEPSGSPRGPLEQAGVESGHPPLPSPAVPNTYDRQVSLRSVKRWRAWLGAFRPLSPFVRRSLATSGGWFVATMTTANATAIDAPSTAATVSGWYSVISRSQCKCACRLAQSADICSTWSISRSPSVWAGARARARVRACVRVSWWTLALPSPIEESTVPLANHDRTVGVCQGKPPCRRSVCARETTGKVARAKAEELTPKAGTKPTPKVASETCAHAREHDPGLQRRAVTVRPDFLAGRTGNLPWAIGADSKLTPVCTEPRRRAKYMPTPPMVMPQYMTTYASYYSQPAVYVVHSGAPMPPSQAGFGLQPMHPMQAHAGHPYLPHPLEPVHHPVPYDFSVPPPNYTYVPMAPPPHPPPLLAAHPPPFNLPGPAMYKIPDRFVPLESGQAMGPGGLGNVPHERMHPVHSGEVLMEPSPCEPLGEGVPSQEPTDEDRRCAADLQPFNQHLPAQTDDEVTEVTEIIEEIHIFERPRGHQQTADGEMPSVGEHVKAGAAVLNEDAFDRRSSKSWYDECTSHEQSVVDDTMIKDDTTDLKSRDPLPQAPSEEQKIESPDSAVDGKTGDSRRTVTPSGDDGHVNPHGHVRQCSEPARGPRDGEAYPLRRRNQNRDSRDGRRVDSRDSTRERSGGRFDNHGRRSLTPEKRYRGNAGYDRGQAGPGQWEDRRFSNLEHGAGHLRACRPRGAYDQAPSRESSAGRRDNNGNAGRQSYYPSPKRDGNEHRYDNHGGRRYDGSLRRGGSGSYRGPWRENGYLHANRDEFTKPIPRGGGCFSSGTNSNSVNSRKPPLPRQDSSNSAASGHITNGTAYPVLNGTASFRKNPVDVDPSPTGHDGKGKERSDDEPAFLEFLGPSLLGINDRLDVKDMIIRGEQKAAVSIGGYCAIDAGGDQTNVKNNHSSGTKMDISKRAGGDNVGGGGGQTNMRQGRKDHHRE
ncbi:hypothetical protein BIW11_07984 [Tropilaelaps mercedesae]|uniref:Btz domain-containing protein n=1 Tax=Tropilaelaps mercedesae TaxID=418985 RepID=A0A1V9XRJ4_9ACAR|nr:hypothetical protein BIW11_07984 [Tropilaelaps mercedesae]